MLEKEQQQQLTETQSQRHGSWYLTGKFVQEVATCTFFCWELSALNKTLSN